MTKKKKTLPDNVSHNIEDATGEMILTNEELISEFEDSEDPETIELVRRFKLALRQLAKPQHYFKNEYGNLKMRSSYIKAREEAD